MNKKHLKGDTALKPIGKPADNVSKAKNPEEAKGIIRGADMELSDEEMGQAAGGSSVTYYAPPGTLYYQCSECHKDYTPEDAEKYNYRCPLCQFIMISHRVEYRCYKRP